MPESFQKTAKTSHELPVAHPGIIDSEGFDKYFQLQCYEPSQDLKPFVTHIWIQRRRQISHPTQKPPVEVLSGPNMYLFFTAESAFIHGVTRHEFEYDAFASEVIAGVKFRPGGFHAFLGKSVSELDTDTSSIASIFPAVNDAFRQDLLNQSNGAIVARLELLLLSKKPEEDKNLELVAGILSALDSDTALKTVGSVAQAFHISERSVQLLFQTYVGVGLKWVLTRRRLLETVSRIKEQSDSSQAEVAVELGYNSQSHFTREFKDVMGQPPSRYFKSL
jgi:AraC-like DNA-binding protein